MAAGSDPRGRGGARGPGRRTLGATAAAAGLLALLLFLLGHRDAPVPEPGPRPASLAEGPGTSFVSTHREATPEAASALPQADPAPIIEEVTLEKSEVCAGEENLVTVKAHAWDGSDDRLHVLVGSGSGFQVPVQVWSTNARSGDPEDIAWPTITVFDGHGNSTTRPVPAYRVKDCKAERAVYVTHALQSNTTSTFEFSARLVDTRRGAPPLRATRFVWTFGDGSSIATTEPYAVHGYDGRPQSKEYSEFLVRVEATLADGKTISGRDALELVNSTYEAFVQKHVVMVEASLNPRFPVRDKAGVVHQGIRLSHARPDETVKITRLTAQRHTLDGKDLPPVDVDPVLVLGRDTIPPGENIEASLELDTMHEPGIFSIDYELEGTSSGGFPANARFSVMRPPDMPTKETSIPVKDPTMTAKILAAREILHQEFVTDDDLIRLEREGEFAKRGIVDTRAAQALNR